MKLEHIIESILKLQKEVTTTAGTPGYDTPNAFTGGKKKNEKRRKKTAQAFGYRLTGTSDLKELALRQRIRSILREIKKNESFKENI